MRQRSCFTLSVGCLLALASPGSAGAAPCIPLSHLVGDVDGDGRPDRLLACRLAPRGRHCDALRLRLSRGRRDFDVARRCRGPNGMRGGDDSVSVKDGQLVQRRRGGSAWAWKTRCAVDLRVRRPGYQGQPRVVRLVRRGWWTVQPRRYRRVATIDFRRWVHKVEWSAPLCIGRTESPGRRLFHGAFAPIPLAQRASTPKWPPRTPHDRRCLLALSEGGYRLPARPSRISPRAAGAAAAATRAYRGARDAELLLWAFDVGGRELLLRGRVHDDRWTAADRLHLWLGRRLGGYMNCVRGGGDHLVSARVDGARSAIVPLSLHVAGVSPKFGVNLGLSARIARRGRWLHFELRLTQTRRRQALRFGIALAYADGDDHTRKPRYLLATARLDPGDGRGLGELGPSFCVDRRGRLVAHVPRTCSTLLP